MPARAVMRARMLQRSRLSRRSRRATPSRCRSSAPDHTRGARRMQRACTPRGGAKAVRARDEMLRARSASARARRAQCCAILLLRERAPYAMLRRGRRWQNAWRSGAGAASAARARHIERYCCASCCWMARCAPPRRHYTLYAAMSAPCARARVKVIQIKPAKKKIKIKIIL